MLKNENKDVSSSTCIPHGVVMTLMLKFGGRIGGSISEAGSLLCKPQCLHTVDLCSHRLSAERMLAMTVCG